MTYSQTGTGSLIAALIVSVVAQGISAPRARACVSAGCENPVRTFGPDAAVPGNLVRFQLSPRNDVQSIELELMTLDGELVPLREHGQGAPRVLEPVSAIEPGLTLELHYAYDCVSIAERIREVYRFTTLEHAVVEMPEPQLVLIEEGVSDVPTGFKRYRFEPPVSDGAAHLADVSVMLDGRALGALDGGPALRDGVVTVHSSCDGTASSTSCSVDTIVSSGRHQLQLATTIVGEEIQPAPVVRTVDVECPDGCSVTRPAAARGTLAPALGMVLAAVACAIRSRRRLCGDAR